MVSLYLARRLLFLSAIFSCLIPFYGFSEGTKQIMPTNTGIEKIDACSPSGTLVGFAYYLCPADNRLNIHIKQPGEIIYYGLRKNDNNAHQFRIKDPTGNIVVGPTNIPTTGTGYINTYDQAVAGPSQIAGASGYDASIYTALVAGDYYIEFSNTVTLLYFDITVADASNAPIDGRVWSKAWQFDTGTDPGTSNGTYFIYSDDGVVTSMGLHGLQGITFTVACNQMGCPMPAPGTGFTRKSVNGKHVLPQYKIFLNNPDETEYPTGTLGTLSNLVVTWNCNGTATITFDVTKAGDVDILLDINSAPGVQAEDVLISQAVVLGTNSILWNGLNGLGVQVLNGTTFNITVTYILGLTNFPVYDVEANSNGLVVNLVRPTGGQLLMYWDDTLLSGTLGCTGSQVPPVPNPISNYTGCVGSGGCHIWTSVGGNPGQCSYGNERTANTYWYAVYSTYSWPNFIVHRAPITPLSPTGPSSVCIGDLGKTYSVSSDPNTATYTWEYTGTGAVFNPPNPTGPTATLDFPAGSTSGQIRVRGWNQNCGDGNWSSPTSITVNLLPDLTNTLTASICSGQTFQTTLTSVPPTTDFSWTVDCNPPGIFVSCPPGQIHLNVINDLVSITGTNPGTVNYHITPVAAGCTGETKNLILSVNPIPDAATSPGPNSSICSEQTTGIHISSSFSTTQFTWPAPVCTNIQTCPSAGSGTLIAEPLQVASALVAGSVVYTITPSNGGCVGIPIQHTVTVNPLPDVQLAVFAPVCLNTPQFTLSGGTPLLGTYTQGGVPVTTFNPATAGVGTYPITYTYSDANLCTKSVTKDILVQGLIQPNLTGSLTPCLGVVETYMTDATGVPGSYLWTVTPNGSITYGASPDIITITWPTTGPKTITVSYTDPNGCATIPKSIIVTVNPLPVPTIVTGNLNACVTQTYSYTTQNGMSAYSWIVSPGNTITFTNNTASITWNVISPNEWIDVNYVDANGCTAVTPARTTVNVNPSPSFLMTGLQSVCAGSGSVAYNLPSGQLGIWSLTSGGSITAPFTNVNSILVNWTPSNVLSQATLTVNYSNTLGCSGTTPKTIDIQPLPMTNFTAAIPSPVCQDFPTASVYTVTPGGVPAAYLWQVNPAANASIADPTANPVSITWKLSGSSPQTAQLSLQATTTATNPACISTSSPMTITINPKPDVSIRPCFDLVTSRSAKPFLLKGGIPLLTSTPLQGEYLISPATTALYSDAGGNYYFNPALVPGNATTLFNISYKYTSSQYGCIATSPSTVGLAVRALNPACGMSMVDYRDNITYPTANFNGKCWMTQNLRYGTSLAASTPQSDNCSVEKYCLTTDLNCTTYGGLYQWDELIQYGVTAGPAYQGVCPPGWHVPTMAEWQDLIDYVAGMSQGDGIAGSFLVDPNPLNGFHTLLDGIYYMNNTWAFASGTLTATMFWTSTTDGTTRAIARGMNNFNYSVSFYPSSLANAFSVRCVKDN